MNLQLIPCELIHFEAFLRDKKELASALGVSVPDSWPVFAEAMPYAYERLKADPLLLGWWTYLFIDVDDKTLVGSGGFTGKPDASGMVEIGYEIALEYRKRGLATEAARGLVRHAFSHKHIKTVEARTLAETNPSTKVLEKIGMKYVETVHDPEDGELWRWRLTREDYERA
ncbi:MAG: GNAT family N-acetyltransferase [Pyrinomonadaceae bacterium]